MNSDYGNVTLPGTPFRFSDTPGTVRLPPWLGSWNEEILTDSGFTSEEIQELYSKNVIFKRKSDRKE